MLGSRRTQRIFKLAAWTAVVIGLCTAFWQCYEFAYTCYEHGWIASPVWSGTWGAPWPHHYIAGFAFAGASIAALEFGRWKSDRAKRREENPDR